MKCLDEKTRGWLQTEVFREEERAAQFDQVDGLGMMLGQVDESADDTWSRALGVEGPMTWRYGLEYFVGAVASGHGDVVWSAGELLAILIMEKRDIFENIFERDISALRVLEVGAGTGLPSLAAALRGAQVLATDARNPAAIYSLAKTATALHRKQPQVQFSVAPLNFGEILCNESPFDVILAADTIYNPESHTQLLHTVKHSLKPQTGIAVFSYALHKNVSDTQVRNFFHLANEFGFLVDHSRPGIQMPLTDSMRGLCCDTSRAFVYITLLSLPSSSSSSQ